MLMLNVDVTLNTLIRTSSRDAYSCIAENRIGCTVAHSTLQRQGERRHALIANL